MSCVLMWATPDADKAICDAARVSNPENREKGSVEKLVAYLMKNGHWSPFEMANVCVEIKAPRYVTRQILRHRSMHFQEYSLRYSTPLRDFEIPDCRVQGATSRQASVPCEDPDLRRWWDDKSEEIVARALQVYDEMVAIGVAREVARSILPECIMSALVVNATIRSWIHFFAVRLEEHAQPETREVAERCWRVVAPLAPISFSAARSVWPHLPEVLV